jgi:hypothetical protein
VRERERERREGGRERESERERERGERREERGERRERERERERDLVLARLLNDLVGLVRDVEEVNQLVAAHGAVGCDQHLGL